MNISLAQKDTVLTNFGDIITMCIVAMVSMSIVKKSLDNMNDSTVSTVRFAHLSVGNMAILSNSCKLSSASSCASTHAVQICSQRVCMLAAASRKRRRCEPAIQPRQSACYSLQAPGLPMPHSPASGLRQGRHRACQGMPKSLVWCCTALCCCSYMAVPPCASAVSDHAALLYRIIKSVVGNHASIRAIGFAQSLEKTEFCGKIKLLEP